MTDKIEISAVHLSTIGDKVIVAIEVNGAWHRIIEERADNAYSHIWEAHAYERMTMGAIGTVEHGAGWDERRRALSRAGQAYPNTKRR